VSVDLYLQARERVDPYGTRAIFNPSNGATIATSAFDNRIAFTGHALDIETGEYYCRARYFDPSLGAWLGRDPSGYADGGNLYQYCRSNPWGLFDPYGLNGQGKVLTTWDKFIAGFTFSGASALQDQFNASLTPQNTQELTTSVPAGFAAGAITPAAIHLLVTAGTAVAALDEIVSAWATTAYSATATTIGGGATAAATMATTAANNVVIPAAVTTISYIGVNAESLTDMALGAMGVAGVPMAPALPGAGYWELYGGAVDAYRYWQEQQEKAQQMQEQIEAEAAAAEAAEAAERLKGTP
jgi:RHS repeat-associated protein